LLGKALKTIFLENYPYSSYSHTETRRASISICDHKATSIKVSTTVTPIGTKGKLPLPGGGFDREGSEED
jgi:hypothetical protein